MKTIISLKAVACLGFIASVIGSASMHVAANKRGNSGLAGMCPRRRSSPTAWCSREGLAEAKRRFDSAKAAKDVEGLGDRLKVLSEAPSGDKAAQQVKALTYQGFQYASSIIPEVADTVKPIDDAVRWGFMHEAGPFETWDMLGVEETAKKMKAAGYPAAKWVNDMLKGGVESFYQYKNGEKVGVYDVVKGKYRKLKRPEGTLVLKQQKIVMQNAGATLRDLDDGVACLEFHTKLNTLDDDIMNMVEQAFHRLDSDFDGLVIGNEAENFSAGANLFMMVVGAQQGMWDLLDGAVRKLQDLNMRMRYSPKPIIVAPAGLTLGGGCEITMHASRVVAAAETYIGLVELGAGVIPAGGGTKEMLRRIVNPIMRLEKEVNFRRMSFPAQYWTARDALYKPANWLFDNTPLQHPLDHWFGLWGVSLEVAISSAMRTGEFNGAKN